MVSGYNRMYSSFHHCRQATWWRRQNQTDLAAGDIDWKQCYDDLYVLPAGSAEKAEAPRAVPEVGRSNRDLANPDVVDQILRGIRRTGALWQPMANMYNTGLGKFDLAGKGKGRLGENSVSFVAGANTDRF